MKRFAALTLFILLLVTTCQGIILYAESPPQDVTQLNFTDSTFKQNSTGYEGPLTTGPFPVLEIYDRFTLNNIFKQGKSIAIRGLFSLNNVGASINAVIVYDDDTKESISFTEVDLEATELIYKPLQLNAGREIREIRISHGASGLSVEVQQVYIENAYDLIYTMSDGTYPSSEIVLDGTGISYDLLFMNYNHSATLSPDEAIKGINLTLSKHVDDTSAAVGGGAFVVNFYVGGWGKSVSFNDLTRDIQTYSIPVPQEMVGQTITSIVIKTYQWSVIRKIDYIPQPQTATTTAVKVLIDGSEQKFDAYNINNNNYFKLRDLAMVLTGSQKQFQVGYNNDNKSITLTSGQAYTPVGNELASGASGSKSAVPTSSRVFIDGREVSLTIYLINNNNYFKLRDIGSALDFGVTWNPTASSIEISTTTGYQE